MLGVEGEELAEADEQQGQPAEDAYTDGSDEPAVAKKGNKRKSSNGYKKSNNKRGKKNGGKHVDQEDTVVLTACKKLEKEEDLPSRPVMLSITHKADRVVLDGSRLSAHSNKGYRMVRATRGVDDGPWFFEITVLYLGSTGHTRLGWATQKTEVQAPVGYDAQSYAYRDLEGHKVNAARREPYGEDYSEGDVIGFYINLPNGAEFAPQTPQVYNYRGQPYVIQQKEEEPKTVPGSEIMFFKNGVSQGVAFKDIIAGKYYPAASMYTLPEQDRCEVRFNFGPDFRYPPSELGDHPAPRPMSDVPYQDLIGREPDMRANGGMDGETGETPNGTKAGSRQRSVASGHGDGEKSKSRRESKPKKKPPTGRADRSGTHGRRPNTRDSSESPLSVDLHAPVDVAIQVYCDRDEVSSRFEEAIEVEVQ